MNSDEFTNKAYEKLFESKHHYDNLSWRIGGVILILAGALVAYIPSVKDPSYTIQFIYRLVIATFVWLALFVWYKIYDRNRIWVEAANEAIRDIERTFRVRGAGIIFMEVALTHKVTLQNVNERGEKVVDPETGKPFKTAVEMLKAGSMHAVVGVGVWLIAVLALSACFIP